MYVCAGSTSNCSSSDRNLLLTADEARVVLVHIQLAVQPEVLGIGAEEALDVRLRREHVELLLLERAQVLPANLRRVFDLGEVELLAEAGFPQAAADLEHRADCSGRGRKSVPGWPAKTAQATDTGRPRTDPSTRPTEDTGLRLVSRRPAGQPFLRPRPP